MRKFIVRDDINIDPGNVPRPAESPRIPSPAEEKTDPAMRVIREKMHSELNWQGAKLTAAMCVVAIGTAFGAYAFVMNSASAQTDAGLKPLAEIQKAQDARLTTLEKRFDRFEERTDKQMNLLLDAARVPETKRPAPLQKDGGGE
ncbi:MAG: hypothetical protein EPN91_08540 [Salinibacterium sp.]|nr:MAG: hypothetical protein EPN91_08540 [Salinibacterium sp.]